MTTTRKRMAALLLLGALSFGAAACSSDADTSTSDTTADDATTTMGGDSDVMTPVGDHAHGDLPRPAHQNSPPLSIHP